MKSSENKSATSTNLKRTVHAFAVSKKYFHITELRQAIESAGLHFKSESILKYLYQMNKNGAIFGSGRGWYSNITQPFVLDTKPLQEIIDRLSHGFPLLDFCCWSTAQLGPYFHHLQGKSIFFLFTEKEALPVLYDDLREFSPNCYLNPYEREAKQSFRISETAFVLRPAVSEEPKKGHYATTEKIMVDLFIERERLDLFDEWEYHHLFDAIVLHHRIDMAVLMRYAGRRKVKNEIQKLIH